VERRVLVAASLRLVLSSSCQPEMKGYPAVIFLPFFFILRSSHLRLHSVEKRAHRLIMNEKESEMKLS
jgi:hypothetical protein